MAERTWIEIDHRALDRNVRELTRLIRPSKLMPIVKANAYGHGLREVLPLAKKWPIWGLGVAYGSEALDLRNAGFKGKIAVLSAWDVNNLLTLAKNRVEIVVYNFTTLNRVARLGKRGQLIRIHVKLDTGTSRIGFFETEVQRLRAALRRLPTAVTVAGLWSHFSSSEESTAVTAQQLRRFQAMSKILGLTSRRHFACTAAAIRYPATRLDIARIGLGIYGYWPTPELRRWVAKHRPLRLCPVLRWSTSVVQVKSVPAGTFIGYGQTYRTKRPTRIATIPVGYADGLRRVLSNRGRVQIGARTYPIVGRVCMNLTMIDVGRAAVRVGQRVDLIGQRVTADDHAAWAGTLNYDILATLSPTIPRQVV